MHSSAESPRSMAEVIAETERLFLRTWRDEDGAVYLATCNTDAVTAHLDGPAKAGDIDAAFARIGKSQSEHRFSFWAIERKADGALLG
jgi:RimJ/RimL family protein N-acetyltransferase